MKARGDLGFHSAWYVWDTHVFSTIKETIKLTLPLMIVVWCGRRDKHKDFCAMNKLENKKSTSNDWLCNNAVNVTPNGLKSELINY